MIVAESKKQADILEADLHDAGHRVTCRALVNEDWLSVAQQESPEAVLVQVDRPTLRIVEQIARVNKQQARPVAMFTNDSDQALMTAAIQAGVSAYVVRGLSRGRVAAVMQMAFARFEQLRTLRCELDEAKTALAERKVIERAKGIVMQQRRCSEEQAYRVLQKMAMDQKKRLGDAARDVILVTEVLKGEAN